MRKLLSLFALLCSVPLFAQVVDQSQLATDSGTSARTLSGYTVWQSFTAGITGSLTKIDIGFRGGGNTPATWLSGWTGSGTVKVYAGTGVGGALLGTFAATVSGGANYALVMNSVNIGLAVTNGTTYTFQFIPGAGLPDPYCVPLKYQSGFAGTHGVTDPSGSYAYDPALGFAMVFRTWVL